VLLPVVRAPPFLAANLLWQQGQGVLPAVRCSFLAEFCAEDAIGYHAYSLEALLRAWPMAFLSGFPLVLVDAFNSVQTLKTSLLLSQSRILTLTRTLNSVQTLKDPSIPLQSRI
jgi:hypothetical protein